MAARLVDAWLTHYQSRLRQARGSGNAGLPEIMRLTKVVTTLLRLINADYQARMRQQHLERIAERP